MSIFSYVNGHNCKELFYMSNKPIKAGHYRQLIPYMSIFRILTGHISYIFSISPFIHYILFTGLFQLDFRPGFSFFHPGILRFFYFSRHFALLLFLPAFCAFAISMKKSRCELMFTTTFHN